MVKKFTIVPKEGNVHEFKAAKAMSLREVLQDYLDNMSEEDETLEVHDLFIVMSTNIGLGSVNLTPVTVYNCLGMLEVLKSHVIDELYEDY